MIMIHAKIHSVMNYITWRHQKENNTINNLYIHKFDNLNEAEDLT